MAKKIDAELMTLFLSGAEDMLRLWEEACLEISKSQRPASYEKLFRSVHNLKGGGGLVGLDGYVKFIHRVEDLIQGHKQEYGTWSDKSIHLLLKIEDYLRSWHEGLKSDSSFEPQNDLDFSGAFEGNIKDRSLEKSTAAVVASSVDARSAQPIPRADETVRLATSNLDDILKLMGELSLYQSILYNSIQRDYRTDINLMNAAETASKLMQELHSETLSLRMLPLSTLFRRLERLARDLSFELEKPVEFMTTGGDVALDKLIIDGVTDPLIHIIRNAVDHGLEKAEDRVRNGKAPKGVISMQATTEAHGATIIISDDGGGIDRIRVVEKAKKMGLVDDEKLASMNEADQLGLIFLPGFSTAVSLTDISGRGVGMDVVRNSVLNLGGSIKIETEVGKGTTFQIRIPANLSVLEALVVQAAGMQFAVPNQDLEEIINLVDYQIEDSDSGTRLINLRGDSLSIRALNDFMGSKTFIEDEEKESKSSSKPCLVVRNEETRFGFSIDRIIGQQKIFVRPLNPNLKDIPFISGTTVLSDGAPTMILNMNKLIRSTLG